MLLRESICSLKEEVTELRNALNEMKRIPSSSQTNPSMYDNHPNPNENWKTVHWGSQGRGDRGKGEVEGLEEGEEEGDEELGLEVGKVEWDLMLKGEHVVARTMTEGHWRRVLSRLVVRTTTRRVNQLREFVLKEPTEYWAQ